jgi:hypothetical protein
MKKVIFAVLSALMLMLVVPAFSQASPLGGPKLASGLSVSGLLTTYDFVLVAGETTSIVVSGSGVGDIDCLVLDQNGNAVAKDQSTLDGCVMVVGPIWTGPFRLVIGNASQTPSFYSVRVF